MARALHVYGAYVVDNSPDRMSFAFEMPKPGEYDPYPRPDHWIVPIWTRIQSRSGPESQAVCRRTRASGPGFRRWRLAFPARQAGAAVQSRLITARIGIRATMAPNSQGVCFAIAVYPALKTEVDPCFQGVDPCDQPRRISGQPRRTCGRAQPSLLRVPGSSRDRSIHLAADPVKSKTPLRRTAPRVVYGD